MKFGGRLQERWRDREMDRYKATYGRTWVAKIPANGWCIDPWIPGHLRQTAGGKWTA